MQGLSGKTSPSKSHQPSKALQGKATVKAVCLSRRSGQGGGKKHLILKRLRGGSTSSPGSNVGKGGGSNPSPRLTLVRQPAARCNIGMLA